MDPARMFKESLTSRPELENSQGQIATSSHRIGPKYASYGPKADVREFESDQPHQLRRSS
jgi:hypothetical protein